MGRVVRELLQVTDPRTTIYVESLRGWCDPSSGNELVGMRTLDLIERGVGVFGLSGMDRLVSFMIVAELQKFLSTYKKTLNQKLKKFLQQLGTELHPPEQFPADAQELYRLALANTQKLWPALLDSLQRVGQLQLIRRQLIDELNFSCRLDSKLLCCTLEALNTALITDIRGHYAKPEAKPYPSGPLLPQLTEYLLNAGLSDPLTTIYVTSEPLESLVLVIFLLVLATLEKLTWSPEFATLVCVNRKDPVDGAPFVVGIVTLFKQFHSSHMERFLSYVGQYLRSNISTAQVKGNAVPLAASLVRVVQFLDQLCRFAGISRAVVDRYVPPYIFDRVAC